MDPKRIKKNERKLDLQGKELRDSYPTERVSWGSLSE
jgi:hypothetical protein